LTLEYGYLLAVVIAFYLFAFAALVSIGLFVAYYQPKK
jgi:hypothetical protein